MCGACVGERQKFDSIGVGFTGAPTAKLQLDGERLRLLKGRSPT
jgi:hypothetical protein